MSHRNNSERASDPIPHAANQFFVHAGQTLVVLFRFRPSEGGLPCLTFLPRTAENPVSPTTWTSMEGMMDRNTMMYGLVALLIVLAIAYFIVSRRGSGA